jgi:hypothetical protein
MSSPEASTFLTRSGLAPLRATAASSRRNATAGVVSGDKRNIHGTFVEVSFLSLLKATTGIKVLSASVASHADRLLLSVV